MPLKPVVKRSATDDIVQQIRALIRRRRRANMELLALQEEHSSVFDRLSEINSDVQMLDTEIKDLTRKLYKEGSKKGVYTVYEDDAFLVKATVSYGREFVDLDELLEGLPTAKRIPGLVDTQTSVNVDTLRRYIEEDRVPSYLTSLIQRGEFKTTKVAIQDKTKHEASFTEEEQ